MIVDRSSDQAQNPIELLGALDFITYDHYEYERGYENEYDSRSGQGYTTRRTLLRGIEVGEGVEDDEAGRGTMGFEEDK